MDSEWPFGPPIRNTISRVCLYINFENSRDETWFPSSDKQIEKIFGDKIYKNINISPGKYKIIIKLDNQEVFSDIITVRDDPIKLIN